MTNNKRYNNNLTSNNMYTDGLGIAVVLDGKVLTSITSIGWRELQIDREYYGSYIHQVIYGVDFQGERHLICQFTNPAIVLQRGFSHHTDKGIMTPTEIPCF